MGRAEHKPDHRIKQIWDEGKTLAEDCMAMEEESQEKLTLMKKPAAAASAKTRAGALKAKKKSLPAVKAPPLRAGSQPRPGSQPRAAGAAIPGDIYRRRWEESRPPPARR